MLSLLVQSPHLLLSRKTTCMQHQVITSLRSPAVNNSRKRQLLTTSAGNRLREAADNRPCEGTCLYLHVCIYLYSINLLTSQICGAFSEWMICSLPLPLLSLSLSLTCPPPPPHTHHITRQKTHWADIRLNIYSRQHKFQGFKWVILCPADNLSQSISHTRQSCME